MADSEHPNTADLRTLLALADAGSETAAAKELGISQPVVNRRLQLFFRAPALLRRRKGRVELTDKGREALPAVRRLLRQHDHLQQYLAGRRERGNLLAIGVGASAGQFYLARAIAILRQRLPEWEIQTRVQRGKERIAGVVEGTLDVALVTHSSLQIENIARWACSSQTELQIDELAGLPLCVIAQRETAEAQHFDGNGMRGKHQLQLWVTRATSSVPSTTPAIRSLPRMPFPSKCWASFRWQDSIASRASVAK
jgi:DNA-binding transcriptional LysR family regulator